MIIHLTGEIWYTVLIALVAKFVNHKQSFSLFDLNVRNKSAKQFVNIDIILVVLMGTCT